jgi:tRNA A58 N-methylase Trm61
VWLGDSKKNIQSFPKGAQKLLGDELQLIQYGGIPKDAKPFIGVGSGVLELALRYASNAYRVVTAVQTRPENLRSARVSEKVEERYRDTEARHRSNQETVR